MPTFNVSVDFEVICSRCGLGLCRYSIAEDAHRGRSPRVSVEPCDRCAGEEYDRGYRDAEANHA